MIILHLDMLKLQKSAPVRLPATVLLSGHKNIAGGGYLYTYKSAS